MCPGSVDTNFRAAVGNTESGRRTAKPVAPEAVVRAALRALHRGRFMVTPGLTNAALPVVQRFLPRRVLLTVAERLIRGTQGDRDEPNGGRPT